MPRSKICHYCFGVLTNAGFPGKFFTAPEYTPIEGSLIFLAGPIQGAPDWHSDALMLIRDLDPNVNIASPHRYVANKPSEYSEQVDWETYHLDQAGYGQGCVLFWLAREERRDIIDLIRGLIDRWLAGEDARAHAQTTRIELSRWCERIATRGVKVVIGIEKGFTGEKYIRYTFPKEYPGIQIVDSLEETCRIAVDLANIKPDESHGSLVNRNLQAIYSQMDVAGKWLATDTDGKFLALETDMMVLLEKIKASGLPAVNVYFNGGGDVISIPTPALG